MKILRVKKTLKSLFIFFSLTFGSLELASTFLLWSGLFPDQFAEGGITKPKHIEYQGESIKTEKELWGVWRKINSSSRHAKTCFDVVNVSNNIGARDKQDYLKSDPKDSVVALGDSFMEGFGVGNNDILPALIQESIKRKVYNFGISYDFGILQYYVIYKNLAGNFPHNTVIIGLFPFNDFTDNDSTRINSIGKNRFRPYYDVNNSKNNYPIIYPEEAIQTESIGREKAIQFLKVKINVFEPLKILWPTYYSLKGVWPLKNVDPSELTFSFHSIEQQNAGIYYLRKIYNLARKNGVENFIVFSIPTKNDYKLVKNNEDFRLNINLPKWEKDLITLAKRKKDFHYLDGFKIKGISSTNKLFWNVMDIGQNMGLRNLQNNISNYIKNLK